MSVKVKPIPDQFKTATPYLICKGAAAAIESYKKAFGAVEIARLDAPGGKIGHAQIRIGNDAIIMLTDGHPEMGGRSPQTIGGTPVTIYVYVEDVDAFTSRAEAAGAKVIRPPATQFYGDRSSLLEDPFGHSWAFATHVEDVSWDEIQRRAGHKPGG